MKRKRVMTNTFGTQISKKYTQLLLFLNKHAVWLLLVCLGMCLAAGGIGALVGMFSLDTWYIFLRKPSFMPPNWVFGPAWTMLYLLMGYSLFLVLRAKQSLESRQAITMFLLQWILNVLWPIMFFGLHFPGIALIVIVCLWIAIAHTIRLFYLVSSGAAYLLLPYIAWVTFAALLNASIVVLN
jgi:tryptophan-rich sensory protein